MTNLEMSTKQLSDYVKKSLGNNAELERCECKDCSDIKACPAQGTGVEGCFKIQRAKAKPKPKLGTVSNSIQDALYAAMREPVPTAEEAFTDSYPEYYNNCKHKPSDAIREWGLNFNLGSAVKYLARAGKKPGNSTIKDLKKAKQFIEFEIAALEQED